MHFTIFIKLSISAFRFASFWADMLYVSALVQFIFCKNMYKYFIYHARDENLTLASQCKQNFLNKCAKPFCGEIHMSLLQIHKLFPSSPKIKKFFLLYTSIIYRMTFPSDVPPKKEQTIRVYPFSSCCSKWALITLEHWINDSFLHFAKSYSFIRRFQVSPKCLIKLKY